MMRVSDMTELAALLAQAQFERAAEIRCELTPALSTRVNDAQLAEALVVGLSMARGVQHRIIRSRGRGIVLMAKVRYRDGVRMLAGDALSQEETAALNMARSMTADILQLDADERFGSVYDWVCRNIRYVHTAPGKKGYERLVGAAGALLDSQANCQGFADVLYLLCGLCGIECEYRIGRGAKKLHVWNAVHIGDVWQNVDASRGAREKTDSYGM